MIQVLGILISYSWTPDHLTIMEKTNTGIRVSEQQKESHLRKCQSESLFFEGSLLISPPCTILIIHVKWVMLSQLIGSGKEICWSWETGLFGACLSQ